MIPNCDICSIFGDTNEASWKLKMCMDVHESNEIDTDPDVDPDEAWLDDFINDRPERRTFKRLDKFKLTEPTKPITSNKDEIDLDVYVFEYLCNEHFGYDGTAAGISRAGFFVFQCYPVLIGNPPEGYQKH